MAEIEPRRDDAGAPSRGDLIEEALVLGLIALGVGAYEWGSRGIGNKALNMMVVRPVLVLAWLLIAAVLVRHVLLPALRSGAAATTESGPGASGGLREALPKLIVAGMLMLYVIALPLVPFLLSTGLFMAGSLIGLGNRSPVGVGVVSVATAVGLYLLGQRLFGATLP